MDDRLKVMARVGYAAKGAVYLITGILTFLAALRIGGKHAGKKEAINFLDGQPFGNVLLVVLAAGILSYAIWRFVQAFADPEKEGTDKKAILNRVTFFSSGFLYLSFAVLAVLEVVGKSSSDSDSDEKTPLLATTAGLIGLAIFGVVLIIRGIGQFIKAYKNKYLDEFNLGRTKDSAQKAIKGTAKFGLLARGVIFVLIGIFAIKAALNSNPEQIKSTSDVFAFIQTSSYGGFLLSIVACGLVSYAIYMFLLAKYRKFKG